MLIVLLQAWNVHALPAGQDGSDVLLVLVGASLLAASLTDSHAIQTLFVMQMALSGVLIYFVAGLAKVRSRLWRSGLALPAVLWTAPDYGGVAGRAIRALPKGIQAALSWFVIILEIAAPAALILPQWGASAYLVGLLTFHLGVAATLGLTGFLYTMPCFYPYILLVNRAWPP